MPTPIAQLLSRTVYTTDGVTSTWEFSFTGGYIDKAHVKAAITNPGVPSIPIPVTLGMFVGPYQLTISPPLTAGQRLTIYRDTPKDLPLVNFTDEAGLSEIALDTNAKQAVFIAAESTDVLNTSDLSASIDAAAEAAISAGIATTAAVAAQAAADAAIGAVGGSAFSGTTLSNFSLTTSTPNGHQYFTDTNPTIWAAGPGRKTVDFEFISNDYFAANPNGHVAVICRADLSPGVLNVDLRGAGAIMGDLTFAGFAGDQARFRPTSMIESWSRPQIPGQRFIWPETTGPRGKTLQDNVRYRWIIETTKQPNQPGIYTRQRLYRANESKIAWDLEVDTGDVLDASNVSDMTLSGLSFLYVFSDDLVPWSIAFSNVKVTWGPPGASLPDHSASVSKYGADLQGDLTFLGASRKMGFQYSAGPSFADAFAVQSTTPDAGTSLLVKPNGASKAANTMCLDNSAAGASYSGATYGINNNLALVETFINGAGSTPNFAVNVGPSGRVATFTPTEVTFTGGIAFSNTAKRFNFPFYGGGASLVNQFTFQSSTLNTPTSWLVKPNGTSTTSQVVFSNNQASDTVYGAISYGIVGGAGVIETFALGGTTPVIGLNVGASNRIVTISTEGLKLKAASRTLGDAPTVGYGVNLTNFGGANSSAFCSSGNLNIDTLCTATEIAGYIGASASGAKVEDMLRPLYCLVSNLIKDLQLKKVI